MKQCCMNFNRKTALNHVLTAPERPKYMRKSLMIIIEFKLKCSCNV